MSWSDENKYYIYLKYCIYKCIPGLASTVNKGRVGGETVRPCLASSFAYRLQVSFFNRSAWRRSAWRSASLRSAKASLRRTHSLRKLHRDLFLQMYRSSVDILPMNDECICFEEFSKCRGFYCLNVRAEDDPSSPDDLKATARW